MSEKIRMTAALHPFKSERKRLEFDPNSNLTVSQMLGEIENAKINHARVFIRGVIIPRADWDKFKPKSGDLVEVRAYPMPRGGGGGGGGGKSIWTYIAYIAIIAISFYAAPLVAGALFGTALYSGAVFVGLSAAGILAYSSLVPTTSRGKGGQSIESLTSSAGTTDSPTLFINGARNSLSPFAPVPQILGTYRMYPPLGAKAYTEIIGDGQYVRLLLIWGIGPVEIDLGTIKIGETPITEFDGVEMEHRMGYDTDEPLTLFPSAINQEDLSVLLSQAEGWVTRTSAIDADELSVDLGFLNGLVQFNDLGERVARTVNVEIEYREAGSGDWLKIDTAASKFKTTIPDDFLIKFENELEHITFSQNKTSAVVHGIRWAVPVREQYEIRIRRTTSDTDSDRISDKLTWTALRTITNEDPVNLPVPVAKTALVIKATDQLNGVVDSFNAIVTTKCKDWVVSSEGGEWVEDQETQNPASLFRHVLQGNAINLPLADARIDLETLQEWHEFCEEKGFKFNMVRDFSSSVWQTLSDIAAAGRASPTMFDGKWSVAIDKVQDIPVSLITSRNSYDFKSQKFFLEIPHAWRVEFPNEDQGYSYDERRIYRSGYNASNATKFESLQILGVTNSDQIYKLGKYRMAQVAHQTERWTFSQDMEFLTYRRGDRVSIAHDVLLVGLASGRVKEVFLNSDGEVTGVLLDETVTMEADKDYGIAVRNIENSALTAQVVTVVGSTKELEFSTPIPAVGSSEDQAINVGDLFGFGILGEEKDDALIISIKPGNDLKAQVVAIPYREEIYAADSEEVPDFDTSVTAKPTIPAPNVISLFSDGTAIIVNSDGSLKYRIGINFDPLNTTVFGVGSELVVQIRRNGTGEPFYPAVIEERGSSYVFVGDILSGETVDLRLRWSVGGRWLGPWTTVTEYAVSGEPLAPADVSGFAYEFEKELVFRWQENIEKNFAGFEIRMVDEGWGEGDVFDSDSDSDSGSNLIVYKGSANTFTISLPESRAPGTFYIKAFNTSGVYSENAQSLTPTNAAPSAPTVTPTQWFGFAKLEWADVADVDLKYYEVYKSATGTWAGEEALEAKLPGTSAIVQGNAPIDALASAVSSTSITDAAIAGAGVNYFVGDVILQTSGTHANQEAIVTAYNNSTGQVTVASWPSGTPSIGDKFVIKDRAHFKVRAVDAYGVGSFSSSVQVDFTPLSESELGDNIISARKLTTGELITLTAQIKDAIITSAKIASLAANKITTGTLAADQQINVGDSIEILGSGAVRVYSDSMTIEEGINDKLDWVENGSTKVATLDPDEYSPSDLAAHVQALMRAEGDADTTVVFNSTTKKITIANSTLSTLVLEWETGANNLSTCGRALGFAVGADDSAALSYEADYPCTLRVELGELL